jgi:3-hydroxyisobutyrate dehydrogenase-like beta-hydroxyacid dehydrogenase
VVFGDDGIRASLRTFTVGDEPKTANLVKLSGNFLIASVIESVGEVMALVGKSGVDKEQGRVRAGRGDQRRKRMR